MKKSILIFVFMIMFPVFVLAQDLPANSKIDQVTVYAQGALVSRSADLKLPEGAQRVIFSDIIPALDENSLRVSGEGAAQVKILGAYFKKEFLKESADAKVKELQEKIQEAQDQIRRLNDTLMVLQDKKSFLDSVRLFSQGQLPKELVTKMPSPQELEETLKFLDARLRDNYKETVDVELSLREAQKNLDVLNRELISIAGEGQKQKVSIVVDLEAEKSGDFTLHAAYRVSGASWYPLYDARADFAKSQVELISFGMVKQSSGDDWENVNMQLSTAPVNVSAFMPEVSPWFIRPFAPQMERMRSGSFGMRQEMTMQVNSMSDAFEGKVVALAAPKAAQYSFTESEEKGVALVYKLAHPQNLKSGAAEYKLPVAAQILKSNFEYSAYPRLSPYAYLLSRVANAKDQQLLGGTVNIFLEGDFVGQGRIKNVGPGEEFNLYLGVDENVKIKRQQLEKKTDDVFIANIPSPSRKVTYKFKLAVENYKNSKIKVNLFEAMPVSENEKIKVTLGTVSLVPKDKDWKNKKGVWRWEIELEPKAKQEIFYSYSVECPREMNIEGLE
jgi:uncharacterized protein (TIGR02231 family)